MRFKTTLMFFILCCSLLNVSAQKSLNDRINAIAYKNDSLHKALLHFTENLPMSKSETKSISHNSNDFALFTSYALSDIQASLKKVEYTDKDYYRLILETENSLNYIRLKLYSSDTLKINSALLDLIKDYKLKFNTGLPKGLNAVRPNEKPTFVKLTVKVFNAKNKELSGYDVFAKPVYSLDEDLIEQFNPTTHAVKEIVPGVKKIWIEKRGKKISERKIELYYFEPEHTEQFIISQ